jgi:hypothetical protein
MPDVLFGYRDIAGGRIYYEAITPSQIRDKAERDQARALESDGYMLAQVYVAGQGPALGAIMPSVLTPMTEAEFVEARDAGWPEPPTLTVRPVLESSPDSAQMGAAGTLGLLVIRAEDPAD